MNLKNIIGYSTAVVVGAAGMYLVGPRRTEVEQSKGSEAIYELSIQQNKAMISTPSNEVTALKLTLGDRVFELYESQVSREAKGSVPIEQVVTNNIPLPK